MTFHCRERLSTITTTTTMVIYKIHILQTATTTTMPTTEMRTTNSLRTSAIGVASLQIKAMLGPVINI